MNNYSIGIIGMGYVGSSVAISILQKGICRELMLNDVNEQLAEGEAMDLNHGSSFYPAAHVRAVSIREMRDCQAIVITAGRGGTPDESRLDLLKANIRIAEAISEQLKGYEGTLVIVSNPVDVLTYYYQQLTGIPKARVIGTGTLLDTSRLRDFIGQRLQIDPRSVHANVVGEHGDSEVTLWSRARVGTFLLREWHEWKAEWEPEISEKVRTAAYEIIRRKGATNHAIGLATAAMLNWILRGERRLVNVSSVLDGPHGLRGVALSLPTLVSDKGVDQVVEVPLSAEEEEKLMKSAEILRDAIESVR